MMRRRYLAGIFVKELSGASGGMADRGKGKTFRTAGGRSSNLLLDDGMNELDFQTALHVLVHAHIREAVAIVQGTGTRGQLPSPKGEEAPCR